MRCGFAYISKFTCEFNENMDKFDLIVIGGGPAGYAAAMRAIDFGKRVCLIEKDKVGGAGVYKCR